jgi:DNA-binding NarL/FixJ family response regulator
MPIEQIHWGDLVDEVDFVNKIILADSQAVYRAGVAKVLSADEDNRIIAQCGDLDRMYRAIVAFPGSAVVFAASLRPEPTRLRMLLENTGSRGIVIAESNNSAWAYLEQGAWGAVFRDVSGPDLLECVRRVAAGDIWLASQLTQFEFAEADMEGRRVLARFTPREVRLVALVVQGCKSREMAPRLRTTEQITKSCLRSIYGKTGASDRLELAQFTIQHPVLMRAVAEVESELQGVELSYGGLGPVPVSSAQEWGQWDQLLTNQQQDGWNAA